MWQRYTQFGNLRLYSLPKRAPFFLLIVYSPPSYRRKTACDNMHIHTHTEWSAQEWNQRKITYSIRNSVKQGNREENRRREHNLDATYVPRMYVQDAFARTVPLFCFVLFFSKKKVEKQTISKSKQQIVYCSASQMEMVRRWWWQLYYILFMIIGANLRYLAKKIFSFFFFDNKSVTNYFGVGRWCARHDVDVKMEKHLLRDGM